MTEFDERFGKAMRLALAEGPSAATIAAQRSRLLNSRVRIETSGRGRTTSNRIGAIVVAAGLALTLFVSGIMWSRQRGDLHATWSGRSIRGASDFVAAAAHPESVEFSEGSQLLLEPDTRARLLELSRIKAALALEDGHILASIRKHTGVTWTIVAGPYMVTVVGTRFTLDWDRERRALRVAVREGRVRVSGGDLIGDGLLLDAGALLERRYEPMAVSQPATATTADGAPAAVTPAALPLAASNALPSLAADSHVASIVTTAPAPDWDSLARQGKYRDALASAEKAGFDKLVNELGEDQLLSLANAARYSGNSARARQALLKIRERFVGRRSAALAAFYLAREAVDVHHQNDVAVGWFETLLAESPRGELAALARANLMGLLLGMGKHARARHIAVDYLRYHPSGAHAKQARSVLQDPVSSR